MQHLKLPDYLVSDSRFNFKMNKLKRKENGYMKSVFVMIPPVGRRSTC